MYSWWVDIGLGNLPFARDRLVEHYFWANGIVSGPEYSAFRDMATKVICLITTVDDVYDVYGSLEELKLFTDYVDRFAFIDRHGNILIHYYITYSHR